MNFPRVDDGHGSVNSDIGSRKRAIVGTQVEKHNSLFSTDDSELRCELVGHGKVFYLFRPKDNVEDLIDCPTRAGSNLRELSLTEEPEAVLCSGRATFDSGNGIAI